MLTDGLTEEELPIRLAHRVKELDALPNNLNNMPSIEKVKKWYAESFEVRLFDSSLDHEPELTHFSRNSSTSQSQSCRLSCKRPS